MDWFQWDPCFHTGLDKVDQQHHELIDSINQFGDALTRSQGASNAEIDALFLKLTDYAGYHFREEEALMARYALDPHFIAQHAHEHGQFLTDLLAMHGGMSGHLQEEASALISFLTNWLAFHILGSDKVVAWLIAAAKEGIPHQDALASYQASRDPATATLLQAINRLFSQVSERNRSLVELNRTLEERVAQRTQELSEANRRLEGLAMTDVLTNLPNRRHAINALAEAWQVSTQNHTPLSCIMVDADGFKGINDTCGHDAGDEVLRQLARRLANALRTDDRVFRLGGDEFLIICPGTSRDDALQTAEKVRRDVASMQVAVAGGVWHGSVSMGVGTRTAAMGCVEDLLKAADKGVYIAKNNGRNRVAAGSG
jgi:hemerythrin